jgi:hypothetical protein
MYNKIPYRPMALIAAVPIGEIVSLLGEIR